MHSTIAFLPNLGIAEWALILAVFILFFGAKKLPELARGVGKSIKEFKKATSNIEDEIHSAIEEDSKPSAPKSTVEKKEKTPAAE